MNRKPPTSSEPERAAGRSLADLLKSIDGGPFGLYRQLVGRHDVGEFDLVVDAVPPDPFAGAARLRLEIDRKEARIDDGLIATRARRLGVEDFMARLVQRALEEQGESGRRAGPGEGRIRIQELGQAIVERSACRIEDERLEVRFLVNLPAARRRVRGIQAEELLLRTLRRVAMASMLLSSRGRAAAGEAADRVEDHQALQASLRQRGLVTFIADGSRLARAAGDDERPQTHPEQVPFESPASLRVTLDAPHAGSLTGLGVPAGVTLIVGGGFHGKSTLLQAIARGVHPHVGGDGREQVVTVPDAVGIRAEDGRVVRGVDISGFLGTLPSGARATAFSTERASGSTSQAAAVVEALEQGASLLLLDEDRCATNFMIRDGRMQRLVPPESEPIVPFLDRVRELYDRHGVSTLLVTGGSGDYLEVADTVIGMEAYRPRELTAEAREIVEATRSMRQAESHPALVRPAPRVPEFAPTVSGRLRVNLRGPRALRVDESIVDLSGVESFVESGQTRALASLLSLAIERHRPGQDLCDWLAEVDAWLDREGLDRLQGATSYELSRPRRFEIAAMFNRWRGWSVRRPGRR